MKRDVKVILWASVYVLIYCLSVGVLGEHWFVGTLFLVSPAVFIGVVMAILKSEVSTSKTFEEHFYQDSDIKRIKKTER